MKPTTRILGILSVLSTSLTSTAVIARPAAVAPQSRIGNFTVPGPGSVNTWWIEAPEGLIVIDFQRDTQAAAEAIQRIRATGRPVAAMLLTHPHPDHIGGIAQFQAAFPQAPLYASAASVAEIRTDSRGYQKKSVEALKDKAPASFPAPDHLVESGREMTIAGLRIVPRELGVGEAVAMTVYYLPTQAKLFSGDIAVAGMTDFLMEGQTVAWLSQVDDLRRSYPSVETLYPGHGRAGAPPALLNGATTMRRGRPRDRTRAGEWRTTDAGRGRGSREGYSSQAWFRATGRDGSGFDQGERESSRRGDDWKTHFPLTRVLRRRCQTNGLTQDAQLPD